MTKTQLQTTNSSDKKYYNVMDLQTSAVIGTDCIGSCKSNNHMIMTTTALIQIGIIDCPAIHKIGIIDCPAIHKINMYICHSYFIYQLY